MQIKNEKYVLLVIIILCTKIPCRIYQQGVNNHGKIREFCKLSPNRGTLQFCLLKKSPKRRYQKRKQEEKEMKQNLKRKKVSQLRVGGG